MIEFFRRLFGLSKPKQKPAESIQVSQPNPHFLIGDPPWMKIAEAELGVAEVPGPKSNARIVEYHKAAVFAAWADDVPWCSSFVNWVMLKAGFGGTGSALARSWLKWSGGARIDRPVRGCIVVFPRTSDPSKGHVAFVSKPHGAYISCLGGNQSDRVGLDVYPQAKALAFIWPKGFPLPPDVRIIG